MTAVAPARTAPAVTPEPQQAPAPRKVTAAERFDRIVPALLIAPAALGIIVFILVPALLSFIAAFFEVPLAGGAWTFVGLDNFVRVVTDPAIVQAIGNTLVYSALTIVPSLAIGLGLALLANKAGRAKPLVRTALFLPMTANLVAMAVVFNWMFATNGGFINEMLALAGIGPVNWTGSPDTSLLTVALVGVWRTASLTMMIFFAGLSTIPTSIDEANRAEGIRGFTKLWRMTLPMMKPTVVFATVLSILTSVQAFDTINVMTQGGPLGSSETILTMVWKLGFSYYDLGAASALSLLLLLALIGLGLLQRRTLAGGRS
ncbi:MAG: carbohydrate ABC transporter permease [Demequina sp.]|uniref:carbohydrate ABC transporter permease n=1 Tax=Demequina sp. TaxID=2050685 RepID=UPI003A89E411